jgi:hypothetical protein
VIHRIVGGSAAEGYRTRGDNRRAQDRWRPRPRDIEGANVVAVPGAGRALMLLGSPLVIGGLVALLAFVSAGEHLLPRRRRGGLPELTAPETPFATAVPAAPVAVEPRRIVVSPAEMEPTELEPIASERVHVALDSEPLEFEPEPAPAASPEPPRRPAAPMRRRRRSRSAHERALAAGGAIAGGLAAGVLVARGLSRR